MSQEQTLEPCAFCGKSNTPKIVLASEHWADEYDGYYPHSESYAVVCDASSPNGPGGCGASGGFKATEAEAIAAWNRRAALSATQPAQAAQSTNGEDREDQEAAKSNSSGDAQVDQLCVRHAAGRVGETQPALTAQATQSDEVTEAWCQANPGLSAKLINQLSAWLKQRQEAQAQQSEPFAETWFAVLDTLDELHGKQWRKRCETLHDSLLATIKAQAAQGEPANGDALGYATRLAQSMWERDWRADAPDWKPFPHLLGVLTQIDNMVSGMERKQAAQGAGEVVPVGEVAQFGDDIAGHLRGYLYNPLPVGTKLYTHPTPAQPAPVLPGPVADQLLLVGQAIRKIQQHSVMPLKLLCSDAISEFDKLRAMLAATPTPPAQAAQQGEPCQGQNCGTTTLEHSPECYAEHAATIAGGRFLLVSADKEQKPTFKVYKGDVCYKSTEDDQSFGMWRPVSIEYHPPFPEGTEFWAHEAQQTAQAAADARDAFERVKLAGAQLANIAFNLKQRVGHTVSTHDAERMEACQKEWDTALANHQQGGNHG